MIHFFQEDLFSICHNRSDWISLNFTHLINNLCLIVFIAASSPTSPVNSTNDFNRSMLQQRSLFGSNDQTTPSHQNYSNALPMSHNATTTGPPTQVFILNAHFDFCSFKMINKMTVNTLDCPMNVKTMWIVFFFMQSLFDSLRVEQNSIMDNSYSQKHAIGRQPNQSFAMNQSVCDSYLNQSNFNVSR